MKKKLISIIAPCNNEALNLPTLISLMDKQVISRSTNYDFEFIIVNDGSIDNSFEIIRELTITNSWVKGVNLTRNFGKEAAITAGLDVSTGAAVVFIDADLQHPPSVICDFLSAWERGFSVVVAQRNSRNTDSFIYKNLTRLFYYLLNKISNSRLKDGIGDFRLIDRKVADQIKLLKEHHRLMKEIFAWIGYDPYIVTYNVENRVKGVSSFGIWKTWNLAIDGIVSSSTWPLRIWFYLGLLITCLGLGYAFMVIIQAFYYGIKTPGYTTLIFSIVIFGGVQLIGLGIVGEYLGRMVMEVKDRPVYLIDEIIVNGISHK